MRRFRPGRRCAARWNSARDRDPVLAALKLLIDLIAGLRFCAAGAKHCTREFGEPFLGGRIEQVAGPDQGEPAHQGQFMMFEQEHLHAIRQRELFRIGDFDLRQGFEFQILPRGQIPNRADRCLRTGRRGAHDRTIGRGLASTGRIRPSPLRSSLT